MAQRMSIGQWLLRMVAWDGALPVTIWSAPFVAGWLFPNNRGVIEVMAIVLPITALLVRYRVGRRYVASNGCGRVMRGFQVVLLGLGILALVLIDAVMVLTHVMPKGAVLATPGDLIVWATLYSIYLVAMAVAMYPGCGQVSEPSRPLVVDSGVILR